jgi:hypothetical protein
MCVEVSDLESHEECQVLYNVLVGKFGLEKHADSVLNALMYALEKKSQLTPMRVSERYRHPFEAKGKLKLNYREDESIFENCSNWETKFF